MNQSSSQGQFTMDALEYRKVDAEIANLIAMTSKLNAETAKINAEILNSFEERMKTVAETAQAKAQARKFMRETFWYPVLIASGLIGAVATVVATVVKLFF